MNGNRTQLTPYRRLYRELYGQIADKTLTGKLPSIAALSERYKVNPNTVTKALALLKEHRFIYGEQGKGHFVNPDGDINILAQKVVTLYIHSALLVNPFYMKLIFGLRTLLEAERCNVNFVNTLSQLEAFAGHIDVLLLFEQFGEDELKRVRQLIPDERIIACNCRTPHVLRSVGTDNLAGGRLAMERLHRDGHRRIGILNMADFADERSHFHQRLTGALEFRRRHPELELFVEAIPVEALDGPIGTGFIGNLWRNSGGIDALFMIMDIFAFGVYQFMARENLRFAVLGFDDRDFAEQLDPGLSSIREDSEAVAAAAVKQIRATLTGGAVRESVLVPPLLVERASTLAYRHCSPIGSDVT